MSELRLDRRTLLGAAGAALTLPGVARAQGGTLLELSSRPLNYEAPLSAFTQRITPIESFYIRGHFDAPVIDASTWRVSIDGLVDAPQSLGLADLQKLPQHEVEAVLTCSGNGRAFMQPRVPGVQWRKGAMGNAVWRGPKLKDLLALAKPRTGLAHPMLELEGHDRPMLQGTPRFIRGIPLAKALHDDTLLALTMNGAPIPAAHGFPARVIVPGWVGDDWTKWVARLTVIDGEPKGFYFETAYRFPSEAIVPGAAVPPEKMRPMERLNIKSVIGAPEHATAHKAGPITVRGVAFSGEQRIVKVEVALDGGAWQAAKLVDDGGLYGFTVFEHTLTLAAGSHTIRARATDASGAAQPETQQWNPSGYLYNVIDSVTVEVTA
jgi:sulfite oxidase